MSISTTGVPFLAVVTALAVAALAATARSRRRPLLRVLLGAVAVALVTVTVAAAVNAYFDYYPSVATVLGQSARDQASRHQVLLRIARSRPGRLVTGSGGLVMRAGLGATDGVMRRTVPIRARGVVESVVIPAPASGFRARVAQVYLPPAWFLTPRPELPVIELLHGTPGSPGDWTRAGSADAVADAYAANHGGLAPIIVMPDINGSFVADTECVDTPRRRAETYLSVDVPQYVLSQLGASPSPRSWAVVGSSEGGYCAFDLALRHPDRWATFGDFAGLDQPTYRGGALHHLFGGSLQSFRAHEPSYLLDRGAPSGEGGWFEVGASDGGTTRSLLWSAHLARRAGLETHLVEVPGAHHTWRLFRRSFSDAFPWLMSRIANGSVSQSV